jgi:ketosteroid isomerase-like protein
MLLLALIAACVPEAESASEAAARVAGETAAAKRAIDSLNAAYAADQYAEDAEVVAGPMLLKGRAAITEWHKLGASMKGTMRLTAVSVAATGPLAIERGVYTMTFTPPGTTTPVSEDGNYLIHWRQSDGRWLRVSQFASSPNPVSSPPPGPR